MGKLKNKLPILSKKILLQLIFSNLNF